MNDSIPQLIDDIVAAPNNVDSDTIAEILVQQEPVDIALALESLPVVQRIEAWQEVTDSKRVDVLVNMRGDPRARLIEASPNDELSELFKGMDAETLLELADSLPPKLVDVVIGLMNQQQRQYFKDASQYTNDQIGHWLNHDVLVLPLNAKVRDALRLIRRDIPNHTDCIFLLNRAGQFSVAVRLTSVFGSPEHVQLVELAEKFIDVIKADGDAFTAARLLQRSGYIALPAVDDNNNFLGRVDINTACELVNESYERQIMSSAGMDEDEDLFAPVRKSARSRGIWLGINLLTAFLAS